MPVTTAHPPVRGTSSSVRGLRGHPEIWRSVVAGLTAFALFHGADSGWTGPRTFDYGDSVATRTAECNSSVAALHPREFALFSPEAWVTRADYDGGVCLRWPDDKTAKAPFPVGAKLPAVPVLVLNGDLDANTAAAWGRQAAAQFPHATLRGGRRRRPHTDQHAPRDSPHPRLHRAPTPMTTAGGLPR
jgi:hypothetical protein